MDRNGGGSGAARVGGNAMRPRLENGWWVWCDAQRVPTPGDIVLATDGGGSRLVGLHVWDGEPWLAVSAGDAPYRLADPHRITAVVAQVLRPP